MNDQGHLSIVLDCSTSMTRIKDATERALADFLADQREHNTFRTVSLYHFNSTVTVGYNLTPLGQAPAPAMLLAPGTALYDAIGTADTLTYHDLQTRGRDTHDVTVLIASDGWDTASRRANRAQIRRLVEDRQGQGWRYLYLGANQDARRTGGHLGIPAEASLTFDPDRVEETFHTAAHMITRGTESGVFAFTDDERASTITGAN